jgi:hypothetical protein
VSKAKSAFPTLASKVTLAFVFAAVVLLSSSLEQAKNKVEDKRVKAIFLNVFIFVILLIINFLKI